MRVGVIRGDMPGPVFLSNLESVSERGPAINPPGQARYLSRPTSTGVTAAVSGVSASVESATAITLPLTIDGTNDLLKVRLASSGSYTDVTLAHAAYASVTTLAAAVNAALLTAGLGTAIVAETGSAATKLRLRTLTSLGIGATIETGTTGGGSTLNADANFGAGGKQHTIASAATIITALLPVGGALDVSDATLKSTIDPSMTAAQLVLAADSIAPQFTETSVARDSGSHGQIALLLSASFNPDPHRYPALTPGAAITVVTDDGVTIHTLANTPVTTSATLGTPNAGDITIAGTSLGSGEREETVVSLTGAIKRTLPQALIEHAGGSVSATAIVIPASLIPGATVTTTLVRVQKRSLVSVAAIAVV